jgi:uncharacterized cupin superfamily protein
MTTIRLTTPSETLASAEPLHTPDGSECGNLAVVSDPTQGAPIWAGIWICGKQQWASPFEVDETFHVIDGHLQITANGEIHDLTAGTTVFFPKGLEAEWNVLEPFRAFVVIA